jgi:hypothetical protein
MSPTIRSCLLLLVGSLLAGVAPSATTAATQNSFSGRATVVNAKVLSLAPVVLADTGPLPTNGGAQEASLLDASVPGLLAVEALHAATVANDNHSRAEASVASVNLTVADNSIQADFLMSTASATCGNGQRCRCRAAAK